MNISGGIEKDFDDTEVAEVSTEEKRAVLRNTEDDALAALIFGASFEDDDEEQRTIEIKRHGEVAFTFTIHPLAEEDYMSARKKHTKYRKNKALGTRVVDHVDDIRYRSQLIFDATIEEDRKKYWNNKSAWEHFNVVTGIDMVDKVLKAGEKAQILSVINEISGYGADVEQSSDEDKAKN